MEATYFSIKNHYEIKCKLFLPDDKIVKNIIVGVHGFAGDKESSMLEKLAYYFSTYKNTALICFDFPAHGESPVCEDKLTIENCKKDLKIVVNYISSKYPNANKYIFATSFGGYITLLSAYDLCDCSMILRAPAVTMPKLLLETVLNISAEDFKDKKIVNCGFERTINLPYRFYEELIEQKNINETPITSSMLVIHGDMDRIVPLEDIIDFTNSQPNAVLKVIPGADHRFKNKGDIDKIINLTSEFFF